ncbi:MAG TPA: hypothetical protein VMS98_05295 [Thermoanaerobaculia bacterium]|nr:hypothetical protein [Thermoanaerobaculia bacterium]
MQLVGEERREFQRLRLDPIVPGHLGATSVSITEIGVLGARIQHSHQLSDQYAELRFSHNGEDIVLRCEVVRALEAGSGIRFLSAVGDSGDRLREMLGQLVRREFAKRRRLPTQSVPTPVVDGDRTVRGKDAGFVCFRFENSVWRKRNVFLPEQPSMGFTVSRASDNDENQRLCRIYEVSDEEGRRLIRLFAELSVSDALQIPPSM